ncbi:unnamed protein product [Rotaria socialis]|uniref:L-Fucosyltransferase n=2 Tax=Rotaria socialis TaxID=392032 RepID=A0A821T901_9BILA|nr:unnamed protein product [Rotaria socialis]
MISEMIHEVYNSRAYFDSAAHRHQTVKQLIKKANLTLIGVHIRRGDFLGKVHLGFAVSTMSYILRGLLYFSQKYPDSIFIIVSDDKPWCRTNIGSHLNTVVLPETLSTSEDMAMLTLCRDSLITTGTFGWWAATLAGGVVLCDKSYPKNGTWLSNLCPSDQYLPPWFVGI